MIYFDNAATTRMSGVALEALLKVSKDNYGNPSSIYSYGRKSRKLLEDARSIIAECIGAEPEEIFFTSGGSESDNWAVAQAMEQKCKQVITSCIEHHAVLKPVSSLEKKGIKTVYLPVNKGCVTDIDALKKVLCGEKSFVSIMYQNNETGVVQPIEEMAAIVHEDNEASIFHTDAVQALGHTAINVKELGIDLMSASAHKFNGPKGVGFMYVRKGCSIYPLILGGGQERELRSGTENVAGIYAMAKALEENVNKIDEHTLIIKQLEACLFDSLKSNGIEYVINSDESCRTAGVINLSIKDIDGEGLMNMLDMHDVCISIGSACNSKEKRPSYVLTSMGIDNDCIESAVRISMGYMNTVDEVNELVNHIVSFYYTTHRVI